MFPQPGGAASACTMQAECTGRPAVTRGKRGEDGVRRRHGTQTSMSSPLAGRGGGAAVVTEDRRGCWCSGRCVPDPARPGCP